MFDITTFYAPRMDLKWLVGLCQPLIVNNRLQKPIRWHNTTIVWRSAVSSSGESRSLHAASHSWKHDYVAFKGCEDDGKLNGVADEDTTTDHNDSVVNIQSCEEMGWPVDLAEPAVTPFYPGTIERASPLQEKQSGSSVSSSHPPGRSIA